MQSGQAQVLALLDVPREHWWLFQSGRFVGALNLPLHPCFPPLRLGEGKGVTPSGREQSRPSTPHGFVYLR